MALEKCPDVDTPMTPACAPVMLQLRIVVIIALSRLTTAAAAGGPPAAVNTHSLISASAVSELIDDKSTTQPVNAVLA